MGESGYVLVSRRTFHPALLPSPRVSALSGFRVASYRSRCHIRVSAPERKEVCGAFSSTVLKNDSKEALLALGFQIIG